MVAACTGVIAVKPRSWTRAVPTASERPGESCAQLPALASAGCSFAAIARRQSCCVGLGEGYSVIGR